MVAPAAKREAVAHRREEANLHRLAQPVATTDAHLDDPAWSPITQFYVSATSVLNSWAVAVKDVTSVTNARTVIAALIRSRAAGHTLPLLDTPTADRLTLVAMLNSLAYDYFARQKVRKNHLVSHIVEQLPVIPPAAYDRQFGSLTARDIVRREVLALTYTANVMAAFARDLGYDGLPFAWDEGARRQRRTRLDALYFHLYGIDAADV